MTCPICNRKIRKGKKECPSCGAVIVSNVRMAKIKKIRETWDKQHKPIIRRGVVASKTIYAGRRGKVRIYNSPRGPCFHIQNGESIITLYSTTKNVRVFGEACIRIADKVDKEQHKTIKTAKKRKYESRLGVTYFRGCGYVDKEKAHA